MGWGGGGLDWLSGAQESIHHSITIRVWDAPLDDMTCDGMVDRETRAATRMPTDDGRSTASVHRSDAPSLDDQLDDSIRTDD